MSQDSVGEEEGRPLGCSKCRYSPNGCKQCRDPGFRAQRGGKRAAVPGAGPPHKRRRQGGGRAAPQPAPEPRRTFRKRRVKAAPPALEESTASPAASAPDTGEPAADSGEGEPAEPVSTAEEGPVEGEEQQKPAPAGATSRHFGAGTQSSPKKPQQAEGGASQQASPAPSSATCSRGGASGGEEASAASSDRGALFLSSLRAEAARQRAEAAPGGSPAGAALAAALEKKRRGERRRPAGPRVANPKEVLWDPPASPWGLIEEQLYQDPWRLLVACVLLNKTSGRAVRKVLWQLFQMCPTPEAMAAAPTADIQALILPLGLAAKRAPMLQRFSREYATAQWSDPRELHGIGQYGADAYQIFCRGAWREAAPADKDLAKYHRWLQDTDGQGTGLQREPFQPPSASPSPRGPVSAAPQRPQSPASPVSGPEVLVSGEEALPAAGGADPGRPRHAAGDL